jgi:hypothetical protein
MGGAFSASLRYSCSCVDRHRTSINDNNLSRKKEIQHETTSQHDVSAKNEIDRDRDPNEKITTLYRILDASNAYTNAWLINV